MGHTILIACVHSVADSRVISTYLSIALVLYRHTSEQSKKAEVTEKWDFHAFSIGDAVL